MDQAQVRIGTNFLGPMVSQLGGPNSAIVAFEKHLSPAGDRPAECIHSTVSVFGPACVISRVAVEASAETGPQPVQLPEWPKDISRKLLSQSVENLVSMTMTPAHPYRKEDHLNSNWRPFKPLHHHRGDGHALVHAPGPPTG